MPTLTISTPFILFISAAGIVQALFLAGLLYFHPKIDRSVTIFLSLHILMTAVFMMMPVEADVVNVDITDFMWEPSYEESGPA